MQRIQLEKVFIEVLSYFGVWKVKGILQISHIHVFSRKEEEVPLGLSEAQNLKPKNWSQVLQVSKQGQGYDRLATIRTMDTEGLCTLDSVFGSSVL